MGIGIPKDLYACVKDKKVKIICKDFTSQSSKLTHEGIVFGYCFGEGTDMFLELDNGEFVNTRYIASIQII